MANSLAPEMERLPWLTDDRPKPRKPGSRWLVLTLSAIALLVVAAFSYWIGMQQAKLPPHTGVEELADTATTVLPPATSADQFAQPQVSPAPMPGPVTLPSQADVREAANVAPPVRRITPRPSRAPQQRGSAPAATPQEAAEPERKSLEFSNPWESAGASGRMVRVGTYASLSQGKQAWSRLAKVFPGMKQLPAVVTDIPSARNGRVYYRLQIGTTSQAHSEVLCQRMKAIGQSCVVVDLAGARKGSGDERQPIGV